MAVIFGLCRPLLAMLAVTIDGCCAAVGVNLAYKVNECEYQ